MSCIGSDMKDASLERLLMLMLLLLLLLLLHALGVGSGQVRFGLARSGHEVGDEVDGQREDDGGVLLSADARQGLQIAKLQQKFALGQKKLRQSVFFLARERKRDMKSFIPCS